MRDRVALRFAILDSDAEAMDVEAGKQGGVEAINGSTPQGQQSEEQHKVVP
jgi:hypothetical protein